jgi:hypothetical protein
MKLICETMRGRLLEEGLAALNENECREHLESCAECRAYADELRELEKSFDELPEYDAPDALVERVAKSVKAEQCAAQRFKKIFTAFAVLFLVAPTEIILAQRAPQLALFLALLIFAFVLNSLLRRMRRIMVISFATAAIAIIVVAGRITMQGAREAALKQLGYGEPRLETNYNDERIEGAGESLLHFFLDPFAGTFFNDINVEEGEEPRRQVMPAAPQNAQRELSGQRLKEREDLDFSKSKKDYQTSDSLQIAPKQAGEALGGGLVNEEVYHAWPEESNIDDGASSGTIQKYELDQLAKNPAQEYRDESSPLSSNKPSIVGADKKIENAKSLAIDMERKRAPSNAGEEFAARGSGKAGAMTAPAGSLASLLTDDGRLQTEGLTFKEAKGYWLNTYIPGDPQIARLEETLKNLDGTAFDAVLGRHADLHQAARQNRQPFDAPEHAAIGLYVNADHKALAAGKTRMLVQVGIAGTKRHSGIRPPMKIALVLDLHGVLSAETKAEFRAVAEAFAAQKQTGDSFSVIVAGRKGGVLIPADQFRRGSIAVLLEEALSSDSAGGEGVLSPVTALKSAYDLLGLSNDKNAPLGSSEVLYVTASPQTFYRNTLASMAHEGAVAGIGLSAFGLGEGADHAELAELARAGQGSERAVEAADKASDVVARELAAAGNVVARAVRLSIRLAPGMHLVDVLGSRRLDESDSEQVRRAEQSIDQRVARTTGIASDRGKDEEGIQIVIPAFHAGDSHVILLDVVADHPGAIAEVTAKFKDLISLGNGSAQASLALPEGDPEARGGIELNVMKNYLAYRLAAALNAAGGSARAGNSAEATRLLDQYLELFGKVSETFPALRSDSEMSGDVRMLEDYRALLGRSARPRELGDSMQLAALRRIRPAANSVH